ncbi:Gfo/Idh/MocA family protein [Streptacidiphilus carbonis]|jgi:virulence factor|uniref:Gfo/Idh/MocA family protein n=1 Tax=Streptacidiphilus carbonis TaxID=105422 RepID=UPI0005A69A61|nr:Gfo/Idh/MocA family oxidoreductase [Streptacidiphilus carbonis]
MTTGSDRVGGEPLRVGVVGLGDIAEKAYLPVLTAEPGLDLRLMTRNRDRLDRIGDQYRLSSRHAELQSLLDEGLDAAFVHASTDAHVPVVTALLEAGVDVYVDKPLDYTVEGARKLVELADTLGRSLMVGFNRRLAPGYAQCLERPRDLVILQKNREALPEATRTFVFDDFVHVVDTLRFLVPGEVEHSSVRFRVRNGLLQHLVLELSGDGFTALGIMNRVSGSTEEILEVSGQNSKRQVVNLAEVVDHRGQPTVRRRGDWVPVARQRGIEQACHVFLGALRKGQRLDGADALRTHELCEWIVQQVEAGGATAR